ncbi:MAG: hypothetical protein ACRDD1_14210, partial [Planctomycetia bacterium]
PREALPLLRIIAKGKKPTVVTGWGRSSIMLNILGQRYKAPWTYAALEKGMETYPGMATIGDLEDVYDFRSIDSRTPLLAVTGYPDEQSLAVRVLNQAFKHGESRVRCLPFDIVDADFFGKVGKALRLSGVLVDPPHRESVMGLLAEVHESAQAAGLADLILCSGEKNEKWIGFNTQSRLIVRAVEEAIVGRHGAGATLEGRSALVVGSTASGRSIATELAKRGARLVVSDKEEKLSKKLAADLSCRYVAAGQVYSTLTEIMILTPDEETPAPGRAAIDMPRSCAREGLVLIDLTHPPFLTGILLESHALKGLPIRPMDVWLRSLATVVRAVTGKTPTAEDLAAPLADLDLPIDFPPNDDLFG